MEVAGRLRVAAGQWFENRVVSLGGIGATWLASANRGMAAGIEEGPPGRAPHLGPQARRAQRPRKVARWIVCRALIGYR